MQTKPKKPKKPQAPKLRKYLAAGVILMLCAIGVAVLLFIAGLPRGQQTGQLSGGQTHSGEELHNSLDLSLASRADYPSSALTLVKDMGIDGGVRQQIVRFSVPADGLNEYAMLTLPTTAQPTQGYPVIVLCHGYASPTTYSTTGNYLADMEFYARNGFAVIKPDFRGQGLSINQGEATSAYYSMDYNTDVMSLISALKDTNYFDKSKINLWGHSMGAYVALRASVVSKDIKNTILLSGPVDTLKELYISYVPPSDENNPQALLIRQAIFNKYGTPAEDPDFWNNASPISYLGQTSTFYQIHVGSLDTVVPPKFSADLDSQLTSLHHSHGYYVYADGKHSLAAQRQLIWNRSLALLKANN